MQERTEKTTNVIELYNDAIRMEKEIFQKLKELRVHDVPLSDLFVHSLAVDLVNAMRSPNNFLLKHKTFWAALQSRDALLRRFSRATRNFHQPSHPRTVIFLNSISHVRTLLTVMQALQQQKKSFLVVANGYRTQKTLSTHKIPHIALDSYPHPSRPYGKLLDVLSGLHLPVVLVPDETLRYLFKFHAMRAARLLTLAISMLEQEQPTLLVISNITDTMGRCMIAAARLLKIRTLYVQHGMMLKHPSYTALSSDSMAAWGTIAKKFMVDLGTRPEQVIVTGSPQYDTLRTLRPDYASIQKQLKIPQDQKIVTYTSQPHGFELTLENNKAIISNLIRCMEQYPQYCFVIKLHPTERRKFYRKELRRADKNVRITRDINTLQLMACSEAVITQISTTAIEAMLLGKKVLSINLTGQKDIMPYEKENAALCITSLQQIAGAVRMILGKDAFAAARQRFIKQYNAGTDGKATMRVVQLVDRLCR